jgi:flagellar hook assembly protein FlgD
MALKVYNSSGQLVKTLAEGEYSAGARKILWDCMDSNGKEVATGIYFYKLTVDEPSLEITRKLVVIR